MIPEGQESRPRFILDASVAAKWFTVHEEADREKAIALRSMHIEGRGRLLLPDFAQLEVLNAVRYSSRAREADARRALDLLLRLRLEMVPLDRDLLDRGLTIAWKYDLALDDALYVSLADREIAPLVTADEALARRARGHGRVVRLRDLRLDDLKAS